MRRAHNTDLVVAITLLHFSVWFLIDIADSSPRADLNLVVCTGTYNPGAMRDSRVRDRRSLIKLASTSS